MEYGILPGRQTVLYTRLWGNTVKPQRYVLVYWYILVCTSMYQYLLVHTSTYLYVLVKTASWFNLIMPKPHLGGLTVEETALKKITVRYEQVKRAVETRWHRKADRVWLLSIHVRISTYQYVSICTWITWTLHFWNSTSSYRISCIGAVLCCI